MQVRGLLQDEELLKDPHIRNQPPYAQTRAIVLEKVLA